MFQTVFSPRAIIKRSALLALWAALSLAPAFGADEPAGQAAPENFKGVWEGDLVSVATDGPAVTKGLTRTYKWRFIIKGDTVTFVTIPEDPQSEGPNITKILSSKGNALNFGFENPASSGAGTLTLKDSDHVVVAMQATGQGYLFDYSGTLQKR